MSPHNSTSYRAKSGDTLGLISAWYTGSESNWRKLVVDNGRNESTRLLVGDVVRIPQKLVVRRGDISPKFRQEFFDRTTEVRASGARQARRVEGSTLAHNSVVLNEPSQPLGLAPGTEGKNQPEGDPSPPPQSAANRDPRKNLQHEFLDGLLGGGSPEVTQNVAPQPSLKSE